MRLLIVVLMAASVCFVDGQSSVNRDGNLLPLLVEGSFCLESAVFYEGVRRPDLDERAFSSLKANFWAGVSGVVSNGSPIDCTDIDESIPVVGAYVNLFYANGILQALGRVDVYQLSRTGSGAQFAILWSESSGRIFPVDLGLDTAIMVALYEPLNALRETSNRLLSNVP